MTLGDFNDLAQIIALVVGGGWALWRFGLTRESRTFLDLSTSARVVDTAADSMLVVVTVQMKNPPSGRVACASGMYLSIPARHASRRGA